jgi:alkylation response protein AidB-like acyl-CoA dehydrogenase
MDFSPSEEHLAIRDLARQIFSDRATHERLLALERSGEWFDGELWAELARAGLTALAIPESYGGGGLGIEELCALFEEQGRHTAPVPLLATAVLGALPIAEFGTAEQRERWLRPVAEDAAVLSAALIEYASSDPALPRTQALLSGGTWRLDGEKQCVPAAEQARVILVPARTPEGVGVFLVEPNAPGVSLERQIATHREPQARLSLAGAPAVDVLGAPGEGSAIVAWIAERAALVLAAIQIGVAEEAMRRAARYISERKQFGRAIATFQGVTLRAADAWIDVEALRGVVFQAAWRVAADRPASAAIATAKWWAAEAGQRVVHTAQHLHGGIGSDVEYPIHRFFLWSKQNELLLGGARQQAARLGAHLVSDAYAADA